MVTKSAIFCWHSCSHLLNIFHCSLGIWMIPLSLPCQGVRQAELVWRQCCESSSRFSRLGQLHTLLGHSLALEGPPHLNPLKPDLPPLLLTLVQIFQRQGWLVQGWPVFWKFQNWKPAASSNFNLAHYCCRLPTCSLKIAAGCQSTASCILPGLMVFPSHPHIP